jgi:hypothetical protein
LERTIGNPHCSEDMTLFGLCDGCIEQLDCQLATCVGAGMSSSVRQIIELVFITSSPYNQSSPYSEVIHICTFLALEFVYVSRWLVGLI